MLIHYLVGTKGVKTIMAGTVAAVTMSGASFALMPGSFVSELAAGISIAVSIATIAAIMVNIKKTREETRAVYLERIHREAEFRQWALDRCDNCKDPKHCVFGENRPQDCKFFPPPPPAPVTLALSLPSPQRMVGNQQKGIKS